MSGSCKNFGKVYIPAEGKPGGFELLRSTSFSNLDWQWYNMAGSLQETIQDYHGHPFSLGFTIQNKNKSGKLEEFQGKFQLPLKLGELSSPDGDYLEELQQVELDYAIKLKILSGEIDPRAKILESSQTASLFLFMTPGRQYLRESPFLTYLSLLIMIDDIVDNHTSDVSGLIHTLPYQRLMNIAGSSIDLYKDGRKSGGLSKRQLLAEVGSANFSIPAMFEFNGIYNGVVKLNEVIYDEALKLVSSPEDAKPFFQSLMDNYEALTFQQSSEWKEFSSNISFESSQVALRKISIGIIMSAEAIALQQGLKLKADIRSSFLFKWFLEQAASHGGKVNDLLSYNKEMTEDEDCHNEVYILHVIHDWPLEKALRKVLDGANQSLVKLNEAGRLLLQVHPDDKVLAEYIQIMKEVVSGQLLWFANLTRYHDPLVYDCYVEEGEDDSR